MIRRVSSDVESFKTIELDEGFNVVLAERTEGGSDRKSTNGSGKTLLLNIIHFCLGADSSRAPWTDPPLQGWAFSLELTIGDRDYTATRRVGDEAGRVVVSGDFADWPIRPRTDPETSAQVFSVESWTAALGAVVYGLEIAPEDSKFRPRFRSLLSYSARRGLRAYGDPFNYFPQQPPWQRHVANGYFLGLDWSIYQRTEQLSRRQESLKKAWSAIEKALATGALGDFEGIGDLEAQRINLEREVREAEERLSTFQVHPLYRQHEQRASSITVEIHALVSDGVADRETLRFYEGTVESEPVAEPRAVAAMFEEAGLLFPDQVARQLSDAHAFHARLISNRRAFLEREMKRLRERIEERTSRIEVLSRDRAKLLAFLREHGALEDYTQLQLIHAQQIEELGRLKGQIDQLRSYDDQLTAGRIEREQQKLAARADLDDRQESWGRIVELFGRFTSEMYERPGQLVVDVNRDGGLKLDVKIERRESQGVQEMVVFCYDLAVSTALRERGVGPGFLLHDSSIFDGVDPRQKARALQMAARQAEEASFQYLVCLNTGDVPWNDLGDFPLREHVRLELTDVGDGGLLGIRY